MELFKIPADENDFAAGSEERRKAGLAAAGALCDPIDIVSDWGDVEGDYSEAEIEASRRSIGCGPSDRDDVHCSNMEEINAFYDSCRPQNIRIKRNGKT